MYYSFIMLKPDALAGELVETIMNYFEKEAISIAHLGYKVVPKELIAVHYAHVIKKYGADFERQMMDYFYNKAVLPMILQSESEHLITDIRRIVGATDPSKADKGTIRGDHSDDSFEKCNQEDRACFNLIHASDSFETAKEETTRWFSEEISARYFG